MRYLMGPGSFSEMEAQATGVGSAFLEEGVVVVHFDVDSHCTVRLTDWE